MGGANEQLAVRSERYFYDGARRIQEVVTDPIVIGDPGGPGGGEIPIEAEMLEPGSGGTGGGSGSGGGGGVLANGPYVDREYVYVPSGASGYVDEFICQIDRYQDLWYILQDVNSNVIAMTDSGGEVVRQHTFDPYGEILAAEDFDTHPGIKVGHQGLFFDRLEPPAPAGGLISMSAAVQLQPGIFGLYQARNRVLLPRYGRWAQKDPNASGMLHASLWHDGRAPSPELATAALSDVLGDGANLFSPFGSAPSIVVDPLGLEFSFASVFPTAAIRHGLVGGSIGSAIGGVSAGIRGESIANGMAIGFVSGFAGGAASGALFGGSAGMLTGLMAGGAIDGGLSGFLETFLLTGDVSCSIGAAGRGVAFGAATGGIGRGLGAIAGSGASGTIIARVMQAMDSNPGIWNMGLGVRGSTIEQALGANLPRWERTIDKFVNGDAVSIKSLDFRAKSYQDPRALYNRITGYVDKISSYNGGRYVQAAHITKRSVELVMPPFGQMSDQQLIAVQNALGYARSSRVDLRIFEWPD